MKETTCPKCGEVTARYPEGGGIIMKPDGHACKGTHRREQQDAARVIGWLNVNALEREGLTVIEKSRLPKE